LGIARWWINASLLTGGTLDRTTIEVITAPKSPVRTILRRVFENNI
jgi:hypothetical protein